MRLAEGEQLQGLVADAWEHAEVRLNGHPVSGWLEADEERGRVILRGPAQRDGAPELREYFGSVAILFPAWCIQPGHVYEVP